MCVGVTYKFACGNTFPTPLRLCEHPVCHPLPGSVFNIKSKCFLCDYARQLDALHEYCDYLYARLVERESTSILGLLPLEESLKISNHVEKICWEETSKIFQEWLNDNLEWARMVGAERLKLLWESFQREWFITVDGAGCREGDADLFWEREGGGSSDEGESEGEESNGSSW